MDTLRRGAALLLLGVTVSVAAADEGVEKETAAKKLTAETFEGLELRSLGPALMSGRVTDLAVHPRRQSTWYVAVGSGGVWKTTNAGTTWTPIFQDQGSYSIGCVTLDPRNPEIVWVGTGENVGGRHVGYGDGVYRSRDGGASWERLGLETSEHIGTILVDPRDSDVILVAAQGPLWSAGGERGLYKSTDGGGTWRQVLGGGEYTGVNEVVRDPKDPDVLYASTHQRLRTVAALINGGPESGIHKSTDGGETWREVTKGLPEEDMGRIGLAVSPFDSDIVYATIELAHREGGFWRSADGGETWKKQCEEIAGGTGPHYYQEIFASPHQLDRLYLTDVRLKVTEDGGKTFTNIDGKFKHVDNHAMAFAPHDPDYLLVGCDGGIYESFDLGETWKFAANLPVTQFYKVAVDYDEPFYNVYGGTQDNNTQGGPSRTDNVHGIRNSDWFTTLWGDGHQPAVDPTNPDVVYSEWQLGNLVRYDRKTGEVLYIQPQPEADEPWDRFNWDAPILLSPHDPARLYFASQRVWRSDDRGDSWRPVSQDLSRGLDRLTLPLMGRVWSYDALWDLFAMSKYGTITSLAESPVLEGLLYAGTDDGLIQVSEDGGETWRKIEHLPGVEDGFFVNDVKADLFDEDTVYVCVDRHKNGDFKPYVLRSSDRGRSWASIASDLPEREIVWRLVQDHVKPALLFVGTEMGVFFTLDGGGAWVELTGGVPNIPFRDLAIQRRENDLVGATFGRGFYVLDDYACLRELSEEDLAQPAILFPVRKAWSYVQVRTLGGSEKAFQGDAFFTAPNPPFGALFTYYLEDGLKTRKEVRREREKGVAGEGGDTPYPGWDEIREEELEKDPLVLLTVRDESGRVVRRLKGPVDAGFHRVAWDLAYPSPEPFRPRDETEEQEGEEEEPSGFLVPPGRYRVSMATRVNGVVRPVAEERAFDVVAMKEGTLPGAAPAERAAFLAEVAALQRDVGAALETVRETARQLEGIQSALLRSRAGDGRLDADARAMLRRARTLEEQLAGNHERALLREEGPIPIRRRLRVVDLGNRHSTYGPTPTHRRSFEIARDAFADVAAELAKLGDADLPALESRLDAAGVPWSPGRR